MRLSSILAILVLGISISISAEAAGCADGQELPKFATKRIVVADDTLFFQLTGLALDQDGSPEAYGVRDQGHEDICNGLGPLRPPQCRGRNRGACYKACQLAFAEWSTQGADPAELGDFMCAIGLGGGGCSPPAAKLQPSPRQDWFVSETSVRLSPSPGTTASGWSGSQAAQIDPDRIPYFVIPGGFRKLPWDATPGDAGVLLDAKTGRTIPFVVGDAGGALDEASTALHAALRSAPPPRSQRVSALGTSVERYLTGINGDFRVAIFRHSSARIGTSALLSLTAGELPEWIASTAQARLQAIGGIDRVRACTS